MNLKIYQVDAFTDTIFSGNPAAVCPLDAWLPDHLMQNIALENNLSETAFYVKAGDEYHIRWFTPTVEVDLCGHATLAAAHVLFHHENHMGKEITFHSHRSGVLKVYKQDQLLTLDFPADTFQQIEWPNEMLSGFNVIPQEAYKGKSDYMLVFGSEDLVKNIEPDYSIISTWKVRGVIVTAKGDNVDFVSRFFAPQSGVNEDPVTGSAHTTLTPYWSAKLDKKEFTAIQLSDRKGYLSCKLLGNRVQISGNARTYLIGEIITE
jgi:PhzF family phenazine biosynthesis protein